LDRLIRTMKIRKSPELKQIPPTRALLSLGEADRTCLRQKASKCERSFLLTYISKLPATPTYLQCKFSGPEPLLRENRCQQGSATVALDRALVSSYRLSIVTMSLTAAVWPQFAMQVFGVQSVPPFGGIGSRRGRNWYHRVAVVATLLASSDSYLITHTFSHNTLCYR